MKTFIADIIPKIQRYSKNLDNLTLLTNQHWVVIDEIRKSKNVYIFRNNKELLISQNGKVDKVKWEYLGHNSLLIENDENIYLFKLGFFDENILALKIDGKEEYAFLINENKFDGELNSIERVNDFLNLNYVALDFNRNIQNAADIPEESNTQQITDFSKAIYKIKEGVLTIQAEYIGINTKITKALLNGKQAPDGKYKLDFMWFVHVENGFVIKVTMF
jgi:hypothetical protein